MYFETQKLSVGYHRRPLIEDIDIGIWQGGILCLIGPNGSGKSTILRSITRHLTKLGGVVAIGGRDLTRSWPATCRWCSPTASSRSS